MNLNWRFKSFLFGVIDSMSLYGLLYFLQKHITRRSKVSIKDINKNWLTHKEHLSTIGTPRVIEFGAGKSLAQNIYLSQYVKHQTLVDLFPMLDISQFNDAAKQIAQITDQPSVNVSSTDDIKHCYQIDYLAPVDLTKSDFDDNSFDACISTNTLEHIPRKSIIGIFEELKRIIRNDGIISAVIDYSDHYSHTDKSISKLNFLSYTSDKFKKHNHRTHYQNRLRHYDYVEIFESLGLEILKKEALNKVPPPSKISKEFDTRKDNVFATQGIFLLRVRKPTHAQRQL